MAPQPGTRQKGGVVFAARTQPTRKLSPRSGLFELPEAPSTGNSNVVDEGLASLAELGVEVPALLAPAYVLHRFFLQSRLAKLSARRLLLVTGDYRATVGHTFRAMAYPSAVYILLIPRCLPPRYRSKGSPSSSQSGPLPHYSLFRSRSFGSHVRLQHSQEYYFQRCVDDVLRSAFFACDNTLTCRHGRLNLQRLRRLRTTWPVEPCSLPPTFPISRTLHRGATGHRRHLLRRLQHQRQEGHHQCTASRRAHR